MEQYFAKPEFKRLKVSECRPDDWHSMTLARLKEAVDGILATGIDPNTIVAVEQLENELFETGGWTVIDYLWDSHDDWRSKTTHDSYAKCVPAFQLLVSHDTEQQKIIVLTPHY